MRNFQEQIQKHLSLLYAAFIAPPFPWLEPLLGCRLSALPLYYCRHTCCTGAVWMPVWAPWLFQSWFRLDASGPAESANWTFLLLLQDVHHFSQRDALSLQFEPVLLPSSTTNFTKIASFTCKGTDFKNIGDCLVMFVINGSSFWERTYPTE